VPGEPSVESAVGSTGRPLAGAATTVELMPTPLVDWLRAQDDETLADLLRLRPDLAVPPPADLTVLATRAGIRASVHRACDELDTVAPTADPNDPNPPVSSLTVGTPKFVSGGTTFVGAATPLTLVAHDDFWRDNEIQVDVRVRAGSASGGAFTTMSNGAGISLAGQPDGPVHVDLQAHDACRTEAVHTVDLVLDTTPPVVTYTQPALAQYATDQLSSIAFTVSDGPQGSGVASQSVTFDGAPATNGQTLDMFFLAAGLHTVAVTAADNIGNSATTNKVFRVRATAASLLNNLDRARSLGLVPNVQVYNGLRDSLVAANQSHAKGKHPTEWNQLGAFVNQLLGQRGKGIDTATADRFIGYAQDLITSGG